MVPPLSPAWRCIELMYLLVLVKESCYESLQGGECGSAFFPHTHGCCYEGTANSKSVGKGFFPPFRLTSTEHQRIKNFLWVCFCVFVLFVFVGVCVWGGGWFVVWYFCLVFFFQFTFKSLCADTIETQLNGIGRGLAWV